MDITTLAAWGEFLGGIAVVVSLVYLASQIRQNSKLLRASTASVTYDAQNLTSSLIMQDSELARIFWAGMTDRNALSEADRQRFDPLIGITMTGFQQLYRLRRDGVVGDEQWKDMEQGLRWSLQQPGHQQWWREWSEKTYRGEYRDFVDGMIREGEAAE